MSADNPIEVWNTLSDLYDGSDHGKMSYDEAENVLIAWPPIIQYIQQHSSPGSRILDYGCGTGSFTDKLGSLGFNVIGIDPAKKMIEAASQGTRENVKLLVGDSRIAEENGEFDVLVGMMVFQFVENLEAELDNLNPSLKDKSNIVIAVFNPEWIRRCVIEGYDEEYKYHGFNNAECKGRGFMDFGVSGVAPVFIRNEREYDAAMHKIGFTRTLEAKPPFTKEFLDKYKRPGPVDVPTFLILGYTRGE